jgi:hypothetical protein
MRTLTRLLLGFGSGGPGPGARLPVLSAARAQDQRISECGHVIEKGGEFVGQAGEVLAETTSIILVSPCSHRREVAERCGQRLKSDLAVDSGVLQRGPQSGCV